LASATLNTLIGVNVELGFAVKLVDTIHGANTYTGFVFYAYAGIGNNEWHRVTSSEKLISYKTAWRCGVGLRQQLFIVHLGSQQIVSAPKV
jgi:hypothetical protein